MIDPEEHLYSDTLSLWTIFCKQNDLDLHTSRISDFINGGMTKLLTFEARHKSLNFVISQSFIQRDSWLDFIVGAENLSCLFKMPSNRSFYFSLWRKTNWERLFNLHKIMSGNPTFDHTFSAKSNMTEFVDKLLRNCKVQDMFLLDELLIFNIITIDNYMTVSLKSMAKKFYSYDELNMINQNFKLIIETLISSI